MVKSPYYKHDSDFKPIAVFVYYQRPNFNNIVTFWFSLTYQLYISLSNLSQYLPKGNSDFSSIGVAKLCQNVCCVSVYLHCSCLFDVNIYLIHDDFERLLFTLLYLEIHLFPY